MRVLFITENSGRPKNDEDKVIKLMLVINISTSKTEELTCIRQFLRSKMEKVDSNARRVVDFNTLLT